jgi:hypothetical protein
VAEPAAVHAEYHRRAPGALRAVPALVPRPATAPAGLVWALSRFVAQARTEVAGAPLLAAAGRGRLRIEEVAADAATRRRSGRG